MSCIGIKIVRKTEQKGVDVRKVSPNFDIATSLFLPRFSVATVMKSSRLNINVKHICAVGSMKWFQLDITPLDSIYRLK